MHICRGHFDCRDPLFQILVDVAGDRLDSVIDQRGAGGKTMLLRQEFREQ